VVEKNYIFMAFVPHMSVSAKEGLGSRALKERITITYTFTCKLSAGVKNFQLYIVLSRHKNCIQLKMRFLCDGENCTFLKILRTLPKIIKYCANALLFKYT
jgi:hypothetical protein